MSCSRLPDHSLYYRTCSCVSVQVNHHKNIVHGTTTEAANIMVHTLQTRNMRVVYIYASHKIGEITASDEGYKVIHDQLGQSYISRYIERLRIKNV